MEVLHTLNRSWGTEPDFITVRKGTKWAARVGQTVKLCECWEGSHSEVGQAEIGWANCYALAAIPDHILEKHYNESCRTQEGIREALEQAYGPMDELDTVTVVGLRRWN